MTTSRELVESALNLEEVDRIPFCPPFQGYWALDIAGVSVIDSIKNPKIAAGAQFGVIDKCGMDAVETMWDWLLPVEAMGCEVKIPEHGTIPTVTHIIDSPADLDKLKSPEIKGFYRFISAKDTSDHMAQKVGKDHFLMTTFLSPFTFAGELRGVEQMMMDCITEEDFVHGLIKESLNINNAFMEEIVRWETDAVIICDPTASGDLISPDDYAKFAMRPMKSQGDTVRKGGKIQINHICGDTSDRIDIVASTGCKAFSVDYQVDIESAVKAMSGRMAIIGNIDPARKLYSGTPDDIVSSTKELLKKGGKKGYLFGSGCDIPVGTNIDNVAVISDVLREF